MSNTQRPSGPDDALGMFEAGLMNPVSPAFDRTGGARYRGPYDARSVYYRGDFVTQAGLTYQAVAFVDYGVVPAPGQFAWRLTAAGPYPNAMVKLGEYVGTSLGVASFMFANIPQGYRNLVLHGRALGQSAVMALAAINGDTASANYTSAVIEMSSSAPLYGGSNTPRGGLVLGLTGTNTSAQTGPGWVATIIDYTGIAAGAMMRKTCISHGFGSYSPGYTALDVFGSEYAGAAAPNGVGITSLTVYPASGVFTALDIQLYGVA